MPSLRNWRKKRVTKSNDKKVPALRFKGFTDDWEQRKFNKIANKIGATSSAKIPNVSYDDIVSKGGVLNKKISKLSTGKKGIKFKENDILFGKLRPYLKNYLLADFSGIAIGDFWVLRPLESPDFLFYLIQSQKFTYISNISSGSKMPRSDWKLVSSFHFDIPKINEQIGIGKVLKLLDKLLSLQQRKLEELNLLNQGMLQQMFANKDIPKIRFKEFKSIWEHRKLDSLAEFSKGKGYSKKDLITKGNPIVLYGQLYTNYQPIIKKIDTFAKTNKESVISRGREVIVPASGETADDISRASVVNKAGIIIGGDLNIIRPYSIISPIFLAFTLSNGTQRKELSKYAQGKSVVHLHNADLKNVNVFFPTMKEQSKINSILSKLNELNLLSKNKLAILQEIKNALLQILFV